ncbi:hypothetical protein [Sphingomonas sp. Leaf21]|jgi:hypothetical protein|uniref:hypothetical protein n=1 Tax=Sphingomonas sp. Leaf21 TaxID=2876550 RepID=UPI001E624BD9|nr:hypothetical protein [Sphingomonas sp. Leaf21]
MMMIDDIPAHLAAPMPALPHCTIAGAAPETRRMADLPPPVRRALQGAVGGRIAEAGAPFNVSDIVKSDSPPQTRFLRAYRVRSLWLVWVEQGGIGHRYRVLAFRDVAHGGIAPVTVPDTRPSNLCAASQVLARR